VTCLFDLGPTAVPEVVIFDELALTPTRNADGATIVSLVGVLDALAGQR
jgi:hypothetical protein